MRYVIRSLKYFIFLSVLILALIGVMVLSYPEVAGVGYWDMVRAQLLSRDGLWLAVGVVLLSAAYPRFGFVSTFIEGCDIERDALRIENTMLQSGFKLVEEGKGYKVYRAAGPVQRLMMMFEDRVEVRTEDGGVTITGLRRQVVRMAIRLKGFLHNSRYDE